MISTLIHKQTNCNFAGRFGTRLFHNTAAQLTPAAERLVAASTAPRRRCCFFISVKKQKPAISLNELAVMVADGVPPLANPLRHF